MVSLNSKVHLTRSKFLQLGFQDPDIFHSVRRTQGVAKPRKEERKKRKRKEI
jgi:hypothetical protein